MRYLITLCIILITSVNAWSKDAHKLIADVAAHFVSDSTRDDLLVTLGLKDWREFKNWMVSVSDWPDNYVTDSHFKEHPSYHFVHTNSTCGSYDEARDCGYGPTQGICLVTALRYHIEVATDKQAPTDVRIASLKHLIHYMGDVHQPLHVGFRSDFGGNILYVKGLSGLAFESLHTVWDGRLLWKKTGELGIPHPMSLSYFVRSTPSIWSRFEGPLKNVDLTDPADVNLMLSNLVSETSREVTCRIYTDMGAISPKQLISGNILSGDYIKQSGNIVINQIRKAGIRLASLLNSISYYRSL